LCGHGSEVLPLALYQNSMTVRRGSSLVFRPFSNVRHLVVWGQTVLIAFES
jgi:hypothetical protein